MQIDLSFLENEHESRAFMLAVSGIALTIIALVAFALTGGSIIFYIVAVLAAAVELYMAYHISRPAMQQSIVPARPVRKRTRKR
ncbi:MAG: hypothetical protein KGI04_04690 [Candidatus Micrarchaeota archaeon]|nr:hypothetical protein [Candidatus Micrarchaeota archaeon]